MELNDNIKVIISNYYTYTPEQMKEFKKNWDDNIILTNRLFKVDFSDYCQSCYICKDADHFNRECIKFYYHVHVINSRKLK